MLHYQYFPFFMLLYFTVCYTINFSCFVMLLHFTECFTRTYPKVPGHYLWKEFCLPWILNSSITFNVLHFCMNTAVAAFLPCLEASPKLPFSNCDNFPLRFLLNLFNGVESSTLHPKLQLGEEEKVTGGQIRWVWGMGITVILFLAKNCETLKDLWAGALSWWIIRFWFCHFCNLLRRTFSRNLLRTSQ